MDKYIVLLVLHFFFIHLISCSSKKEITSLKTLRIGILPGESKEKLELHYKPLMEHLSKELNIPCKLKIPKNYSQLLNWFYNDKVDLVNFGGYTFVLAYLKVKAVPIIMRDVDTRFTSYFLVKNSNPAKNLADFKGKVFSFGSRLSTSGHLMPRYFLNKRKINPETFFHKVLYSEVHEKTAYWVRDGKIDLGVASSIVINKMYRDGRLKQDKMRVLWETPSYPNYVWTLRPYFSQSIQIDIQNAFLKLSLNNEKHSRILALLSAKSFQPASTDTFSELIKIIKQTNVKNNED